MILNFEKNAKNLDSCKVKQDKPECLDGNTEHLFGASTNAFFSEWPVADLAEFYRILGALQRSGFDVEFVHGITDEGDLWALFEHKQTKQSVLNISLIDCVYNITNGVTDEIIEGPSLVDVTKKIHTKMLGVQQLHTGGLSGVGKNFNADTKTGNAGNVTMHPSACLIAFTASALLLIDLVASSDAEAVETITSIDLSHLTSLSGDDELLDFLFSSVVKKDGASQLINKSEQTSLGNVQQEIDEYGDQNRVSEVNSSARLNSQNFSKLQNLVHDIGGSAVLSSIIAMTVFVTSDDDWMRTISDKIESSKAAYTISESFSDEASEIFNSHDPYEPDAEQSFYSGILFTQQKPVHRDIILDSHDYLISSVSDLISLLSVDTSSPLRDFTDETQGSQNSAGELEKVENSDLWLSASDYLVADEQSPKLEIDPLEIGVLNKELTHQDFNENNEQYSSVQFSYSGVEEGFANFVSLYIPIDNNHVKLDIFKLESFNFENASVTASSGMHILSDIEVENDFKQSEDVEFNFHLANAEGVRNINFSNLNQAEALIFYGGTVIINSFRPGVDAIFLAGEKSRYESVEVIDQDLYLHIDGLNKIVLTDFFAFDSIA